jgi:hypothetical protein
MRQYLFTGTPCIQKEWPKLLVKNNKNELLQLLPAIMCRIIGKLRKYEGTKIKQTKRIPCYFEQRKEHP